MTKTFKNCLALSFLLALSLPGLTQAGSTAKAEANSPITIRLYNYSDLPQAAQARAEKVASDILRKAGITAQWLDCPIAKNQQNPACSLPLRPTELVLRILPGSKAARAALDACHFRELVKALRPFADCADFIGTHSLHMKDETGLWTPFASTGKQPPSILVSDVRTARAVLAKVDTAQ